MELVPFIVVALLIGGVAYLAWLREKRRRDALADLARSLGWRFDPRKDRGHDREYREFEIFRRGHGRVAKNTLTGSLEIAGRRYGARMGDFRYRVTRGTGDNRRTRTYRFSYLIVTLPFDDVPALIIRREGLFDRVAGFFGFGAIDFESAEFSRRFYVNGPDRRFAYAVIDPRMMEFLMRTDPPTIDIEQGRLCLSDGRTRWSPGEFHENIRWVRSFFEHWPQHVKVELDRRSGRGGSFAGADDGGDALAEERREVPASARHDGRGED